MLLEFAAACRRSQTARETVENLGVRQDKLI
jgi:hypothetical protein